MVVEYRAIGLQIRTIEPALGHIISQGHLTAQILLTSTK